MRNSLLLKGYGIMADNSTEIERQSLRSAVSWEEVLQIAGGMDSVTAIGDVVGEGFSLVEDKEVLIGVPLIILDWRLNAKADDPSNRIADFYSVYAITEDGRKIIFNDGGAGMMEAFEQLDEKGVLPPVYVKNGLRVSRYTFTAEDGTETPAKTWYFDTSQ